MNQILLKILSCPSCKGTTLTLDQSNSICKCNSCDAQYNIRGNIPVMLVENARVKSEVSEIHKHYGTHFNYVDHYEKDAELFDYYQKRYGATEHRELRVQEFIKSKIPKKKGTILDVGCGSAWVAKTFCPKGYNVISMDISLKNTSEALKRYQFENHSAVVADAYSLPFKNNSIDYIIASEIIEHTPLPARFVQSLFKVLKPGGELVITTPYKEKLIYSLCIHCNRATPHNAHLHSFDEKVLASLYEEKDLESCRHYIFGNKVLDHLRTHILIKYCRFRCWKLIDRIANSLIKKPGTILVKWKKTNPGIKWNFKKKRATLFNNQYFVGLIKC